MIKNTASQIVGAQMVSATDGSAFSGAVTVYVTGDGGTQAIGAVGSGICTNEGNGFYTYAPSQAETNYNHIAFTFIGTGAINSTIQIYTREGDPYANTVSILADTNELQTNQGNWLTATGFSTFDVTADIVKSNIKYVNDVEVKGVGSDVDPWNPV